MSRNEWVITNERLYGRPCIRHRITRELTLFGKYGEIYPYSNELAAVIVRAPKIAFKIAQLLQVEVNTPYHQGEEILFRVPNTLVNTIVPLLRIPRTRPSQARKANSL